MDTIGKRIIMNRKKLALTQEQLAEKLGVTAQAVSKWENDQSCPDISVLPQLADIFHITIDSLLGHQQQVVHNVEIITDTEQEHEPNNKRGLEMTWNSGKKDTIGFGVFVLFSGILYFLSELLAWDISFWNILWPSALIFFGVWGVYPKFSFFRLGCFIVGLYFLLEKIFSFSLELDNGILIAFLVILFGGALIVDGIKKTRKPGFNVTYTDKFGKTHHGEASNDFECDNQEFSYHSSFGSATQSVDLESLRYGEISTSFGEYTVDLTQIKTLHDHCTMDVNCSFGELVILIPNRFKVKLDNSTSFGDIHIQGQAQENTCGTIFMSTSVSFGEIEIRYI